MFSAASDDGKARVRAVVVMVTFRSLDSLSEVLPALAEWLGSDPHGAVVVVENDGDLATLHRIREALVAYPDRVRATAAATNLGFAPAVNAARDLAVAAWGEPDALLLLNPDIVTDSETIAAVFCAVSRPGVGIAAPLLIDNAGRVDRGSARRYWNLRRLFAEVIGAPALARLLGTSARSMELPGGEGLVDVDITSGAYLAVRSEIVGAGLDVRLPMYLEDQELCHRAQAGGWRVVVDIGACARHVGGVSRRSAGERARELRMMELATAPALSLLDVARLPVSRVRAIVALGGILRSVVAAVALLPLLPFRTRREWALSQLRLGAWFVGWARDAHALDEVSWAA